MKPVDKPLIDIFIPVAAGHAHVLPAALYSALTQTYPNKRVILFVDDIHPLIENALKKWWYTPEDNPIEPPVKTAGSNKLIWENIHYEYTSRGVIIRNTSGPSGTAHVARQWLFEWEGKSDAVKMLDADDILTPRSLEIIAGYLSPDVDGVFCPLLRSSSYRYAEIISGQPKLGHAGSGSMMLRKELMNRMIKEGFTWPAFRGHDKGFFQFLSDMDPQPKFVTTKENTLYMYLH